MAIAAVEGWPFWRGFNKCQCMDCPPGQKKWPPLSVVERWRLVEVQLYKIVHISARAETIFIRREVYAMQMALW